MLASFSDMVTQPSNTSKTGFLSVGKVITVELIDDEESWQHCLLLFTLIQKFYLDLLSQQET